MREEMRARIRLMRKAELHVHLEGSIDAETLMELEPSLDAQEIGARYNYEDFAGFLQAYKWVNGFLRTPADYGLITRRLIERLKNEGVVHAEINISAGVILWKNQSLEEMMGAVAEAAAESGLSVCFVFDSVRQFGLEAAWAVARHAVRERARGVVAFGIGGDETAAPISLFAEVIRFAKDHGLKFAPHAGETGGAEAVREAVECGADRIGHGIAAARDPRVMELLRERNVALEVCVSSNIATGVVARMEEHPLRRLWDAGVPLTLNTDDPPMFGTTLTEEYLLAAGEFGFTEAMIEEAAANSLSYSFATTAGTMKTWGPR